MEQTYAGGMSSPADVKAVGEFVREVVAQEMTTAATKVRANRHAKQRSRRRQPDGSFDVETWGDVDEEDVMKEPNMWWPLSASARPDAPASHVPNGSGSSGFNRGELADLNCLAAPLQALLDMAVDESAVGRLVRHCPMSKKPCVCLSWRCACGRFCSMRQSTRCCTS